MDPPSTLRTAWHLAGMVKRRFMRSSEDTDSHASLTIPRILRDDRCLPSPESRYLSWVKYYIIFQTDSIGFRSGEQGGHPFVENPLSRSSVTIIHEECGGALSCINNIPGLLLNSSAIIGTILLQYCSESIVPQLFSQNSLGPFSNPTKLSQNFQTLRFRNLSTVQL